MELYTAAQTLTDQKLQAFQNHILNARNDILNARNNSNHLVQRHELLLKKQHDLASHHGGADVLPSDIIKLNVGGTRMRVLRETLTLVKGSRLEVMFSGRWENKLLRDDEGCVFMDIDPQYFEKIIEYLYSIKVHQDTELPKFGDAYDQKLFDVYVDFFRLRRNEGSNAASPIPTVESPNEETEEHTAGVSYEDLVGTFRREEEELKKFEKRLDEMEEKLEREQACLSFFTVGTASGDNNQDIAYDSDDSFATISSTLSNPASTASSNGSTNDENASSLMKDDAILNLWVSGKVIPVKRSTICQCEGSQLERSFNDAEWVREHSVECDDGTVLIKMDYPAAALDLIINCLRLKAMMAASGGVEDEVPCMYINNAQDVVAIKDTVSKLFEDKEDFILGEVSMDSQIIASKLEEDQMKTWLAEVNRTSEPELLYRASRDGWKKSDFHSKCDNKVSTITIVKTSEGYVFGGYSDQSWDCSKRYKSSNEAFLFSLKCHAGIGPTKMKLKAGKNAYAVYCWSSSGPVFGGGRDLCVGFSNSYLKNGCTALDNTYELPPGASDTFLTGKYGYNDDFTMAEVEVFRV